MIKVENIDVYGFRTAIRGMRNPKNSWDKSDSKYCGDIKNCDECRYSEYPNICNNPIADGEDYIIGKNDLDLMRRLYKGGTEHRKYSRQIYVGMDITTNHIVWAEFDTYKVGVTRNSCSKMHKIHVKGFVPDDFSHEGISEVGGFVEKHFQKTLEVLEKLRVLFNETHEKKYWRAMLELLPMGYNLKATVTMNYENVFNIIRQRSNHKMFEWIEFTNILKELPYVKEIMEIE